MPPVGPFFWYVSSHTTENRSVGDPDDLRYYRVQDTGWVKWMPIVTDTAPRPPRRRRRSVIP